MDEHDVTNAEFRKFIEATGYVTTAEKPVDWEELKKQVPVGTPKPAEEKLQPGSLVFTPPGQEVDLRDMRNWWTWTAGANWRHPEGPDSNLDGRDDYPVVQVSWDDALAYAKWAGKLPFRFRRQSFARPFRISQRIVPRDLHLMGNHPAIEVCYPVPQDAANSPLLSMSTDSACRVIGPLVQAAYSAATPA